MVSMDEYKHCLLQLVMVTLPESFAVNIPAPLLFLALKCCECSKKSMGGRDTLFSVYHRASADKDLSVLTCNSLQNYRQH